MKLALVDLVLLDSYLTKSDGLAKLLSLETFHLRIKF